MLWSATKALVHGYGAMNAAMEVLVDNTEQKVVTRQEASRIAAYEQPFSTPSYFFSLALSLENYFVAAFILVEETPRSIYATGPAQP